MHKNSQNNIYLNFMRTNPPFDPRMQPGGVFMGQPQPVYRQPQVYHPVPPQPNYAQMPLLTQSHPVAYSMQPNVNMQPQHQFIDAQGRTAVRQDANQPYNALVIAGQTQASKSLASSQQQQQLANSVPVGANINQQLTSQTQPQVQHQGQQQNQQQQQGLTQTQQQILQQSQQQLQQSQQQGQAQQQMLQQAHQQQGGQEVQYQNEQEQYQGDYEQGYEGDGYGEGEQQQQMKNQQIIMFWEHKFYTILQRFQLIFEKVQYIRSQFYNLNNELKAVDSEEEWNQAKEHHEDFMEQLEEFSQELAGVINQNASLMEQNQNEHNEHNIWKQRYFELFEGYKTMEQQLFDLRDSKGENVVGHSPQHDQKQMEILANYRELEREYTQVVNELAQLKQHHNNSNSNNNNKLQDNSVDKIYRQKLDFAIREAEKYKDTLDQLHKENEEMTGIIDELKVEKHNLEIMLESNSDRNHQQNYQQFNRAINERDEEINLLNKELKQLSEKYNFLVETHNSLQSRMQQQQPRLKSRYADIEQQLESRNFELIQLKAKVHESELKQKSTTSVSEQLQKLLKVRSNQLQERNQELQRLRKQITNAMSMRRNESDKDLSQARKEYQNKMKKVQEQYEEKIEALKKKLRKKQEQIENTALLNIKVESLEKKNKMLLQEIETLNNDLHARQKQSIEFKRVGSVQERVKQMEYQINIISEQKERVNATLMQRNFDCESLQSQINEYQARIKSLSQKNSQAVSSKPLMNEIEQLTKLVKLKQNQISKMKANINLKEGTIRELESEIQRAKATILNNEKHHEREKDALTESIRVIDRKNQDNDKKMRELQYQFGSIMKKNLQEQIKNLRSQNQQKQQTIIRMEADELELKSRISHYERIKATHSGDVDELTNRIKELQTSKYDMIKKVENSFRDVKNRQRENRDLVQSGKILKENITKLQGRIEQNQKVIHEKDRIIENLQGQLLVANSRLSYITEEHDSLRLRRRDETDLLNKQSEDLKRKIFEYEHLNGSKKQFKDKFSSEITKIQNQMILQLKEQKQFLKSELAVALQQIGQLPSTDKKGKSSSGQKSKASQGIDYIQKRLFDFNSKLDDIINKNKQINSRGFGSNIENATFRTENKNNEQQIKTLKGQIQQLRRYISKLEVEAAGETIRYNSKNEVLVMEHEKSYNQRIQFYQKQANQFEGRIQNLIQVNTNLKQRVDSLLKDGGNSSTVGFYKTQLAISEETIESLHGKVRKVMEENRSLKSSSNETTTKMCREYEDKIFECETKIFSLERKVSSLELQKNKVQNQRVDLQKNYNLVQTELQSIKYSSEKQLDSQKKNNKQLNEQVVRFENEMSEMLQKIRVLESENGRLTQAVHSSYSQQHIYMNTPVKDLTPKPSAFKR